MWLFFQLYIELDKHLSGRKEFMYDAVHLTNEGSKLAGGIISDFLFDNFDNELLRNINY